MASLHPGSYKLKFKGRFCLKQCQIHPNMAYILLTICRSKCKTLVRINMTIHQTGFHVRYSRCLFNFRKLCFHFKDTVVYYIFAVDPLAVVYVNKVKDVFFMSFFRFYDVEDLKTFTHDIESYQQLCPHNTEYAFHNDMEERSIEAIPNEDDWSSVLSSLTNDGVHVEDTIFIPFVEPGHRYNGMYVVKDTDIVRQFRRSSFGPDHSKIDNNFCSTFDDLVPGTITNPNACFSDPLKRNLKSTVEGSMSIYYRKTTIPVLGLFAHREDDYQNVTKS